MRIHFDEDAPRPLRRYLIGHDVRTAQEMGWAGVQNGALLSLVEQSGFDVLLTFDQNLRHQQNLSGLQFALLVVIAPNKRMETLTPHAQALLSLLQTVKPGQGYEFSIK